MKLIASDLDHTWVGDDPTELRELQQQIEHRRQSLILVYVTGRDLELYRELEQQVGLISPDYLIASVGADIYRFPSGKLDDPWVEHLASSGWSEQDVDQIARKLPRLTPQPAQFRFKRSYYFEARGEADQKQVLGELGERLETAGVSHRIIYSSNRDLDILPAEAGKGKALQYLRRQLELETHQMVVSGDSGNDIDMLDRPWPSVVVSNAQAELLKAELCEPVFRASQPASRGVLEGLRHFGFL